MQEIEESYPKDMSEYTCPVCMKTYADEGRRPGWASLHSHMSAHNEEERKEAYAEWDAERLKEATIAIWKS